MTRQRIDRMPEIGNTLYYLHNGEFEKHIVVEPKLPTSHGIIWICDEEGNSDSIIALFPDGQYNSLLFW